MRLNKQKLLELTELAVQAAREAGDLIRCRSSESVEVEQKTGGDSEASQVVTEVDRQAQCVILEILSISLSKYELGLLTEESEDDNSRFTRDFFWCIDPLDGTLPFVESSPGYAVSIALVSREGVPQLGVIYDPVKDIMYQATIASGALKNGLDFQTPTQAHTEKLTLLTDRSFLKHPKVNDILEACQGLAKKRQIQDLNIVSHGGGALNAIWSIEQAPAIYFKFPKKTDGGGSLWDFAASACIAKEAGSIAGDIYGEPLDLNRPDSTFMNHRGVLYASDELLAKDIMNIHEKLKC